MSVPGFIVPTQIWIFLFFKPELHEVVELSLDVGQDGQTGQVSQTTPLVSQLRRFNNFDLIFRSHLHLQVEIYDSFLDLDFITLLSTLA